jgi:hypothetical protein
VFRDKVQAFLFKIETTSGVDAAPTGVDVVATVGVPRIRGGFLEAGEQTDVVTGTLIAADRAPAAGQFATVEITVKMRGGGAAYSASVLPEADALLRASGLGRTIVTTGGSELVRYTTLDTGHETGTAYAYTANKLIKMVGCVANMVARAEAPHGGTMTFAVTGKISAVITEAAVPALTFNTAAPQLMHTAASNIGTWSSTNPPADPMVLYSAEIDLGNTITDRPSAGAADGLIGYNVSDRVARQTMGVEVPLLASFDAFNYAKLAGSLQPTSAWQVGSTQYNRIKFQTGRWGLLWPEGGERNALSTWSLTGALGAGAVTTSRELNILYD